MVHSFGHVDVPSSPTIGERLVGNLSGRNKHFRKEAEPPASLLGFRLGYWQSKGRGFESPQLHFVYKNYQIFCLINLKSRYSLKAGWTFM